jgi:delta-aminolevulinic acid dehydratase/porphobilinogen synthase
MEFPVTRLRRLRRTEAMRSLVREVHLHPGALIYPLFICPGEGIRREVSSMPGVYNLSIDEAMKEVEEAANSAGRAAALRASCRQGRGGKRRMGRRTASCSRRCAPLSPQPKSCC